MFNSKSSSNNSIELKTKVEADAKNKKKFARKKSINVKAKQTLRLNNRLGEIPPL